MNAPSALPEPGAPDVLWVVDLLNYLFRAYHAMPPLENSRGEPTHATLGVMNMLNRMIEERRPCHLAIALDSPGRGFRGALYPDYKAHRPPAPDDLKVQLQRTREIIEAYRVPLLSQADYEADDIIASCVRWALANDLRVVIASSDKDLMQLIEPGKVWCWDAMRNNVYSVADVEKKFGVGPGQLRELLALVGDSSDNIPGVRGVGPKTAAKLLAQFGSLDELLANLEQVKRPKLRESLSNNVDNIRIAYQLVELRNDAAIELDKESLRYGNRDDEKLRALFTELQFGRFLEMLDEPQADPEQPPDDDASTIETTIVLTREQLEQLVAEARSNGQLAVVAFGPESVAVIGTGCHLREELVSPHSCGVRTAER